MQPRLINLKRIFPSIFGSISIIAFGFFIFFIYQKLNQNALQTLTTSARAMVRITAGLLYEPVASEDEGSLSDTLAEVVQTEGVLYTAIRDETGNIITEARSGGFLADSVTFKSTSLQAINQQQLISQVNENILFVTIPIFQSGVSVGTFEVVHDLNRLWGQNQAISLTLLGIALSIIILGVIISYLVIRFSSRQIDLLSSAAEGIDQGNLDVQVPKVNLEGISTIATSLENMKIQLKKQNSDLDNARENLQAQAGYIEATATFAREMISANDENQFFSDFINTVQEKYGFYQQAIYLVDQSRDWAILRASSGEGAEDLNIRGARLRIGVDGIIGHVIQTGEMYHSRNVSNDPYYLPMTETRIIRSELAIPLRTRDEVIGGIDLLSRNPDAFSEEIISSLHALANQLTMFISHVHLMRDLEENRKDFHGTYPDIGQASWQEFLAKNLISGYYCNEDGIFDVQQSPENINSHEYPVYEIPLTSRGGRVIGNIRARKRLNQEEWSPEDVSVIESLVEQLGLALDSARLYQETQMAAHREAVISDVTTKIRETLDLETIVKTASEEIRKALDLPEVTIHLGL